MPVEPGLIGYAALALLAMASKRYRHVTPSAFSPRVTRVIGILLLLLSIGLAVRDFGAAQGIIAAIAQICVAGTVLVLLLSWRPLVAAGLGIPAVLAAMIV